MRWFFVTIAFLILLVVALAGWRGHRFTSPPVEVFPDMDRQPKVRAQAPSSFFRDGRAARAPVAGTVPLGYEPPVATGQSMPGGLAFSVGNDYRNTGRQGEGWGSGMPLTVSMETMRRGRERYAIFCAVCHGDTGAGDGMAGKFGLATVQSLLQERIRVMPEGEIFNTISQGKNTMMGMGDRIPVDDRWAIIAYLRALQKSQGGATEDDLPPEERTRLETP